MLQLIIMKQITGLIYFINHNEFSLSPRPLTFTIAFSLGAVILGAYGNK